MSVKMLGVVRNTGQPFQITDATMASFGSTIATGNASGDAPQRNFLVQYPSLSGSPAVDQLFATNPWGSNNIIYKSVNGGVTWTTAYTLPIAPGAEKCSGFHPITINGAPKLLMFCANGNGYEILYDPVTDSWSNLNIGGYDSHIKCTVCWQNTLYWISNDDSNVHYFNPTTHTRGTISRSIASAFATLCIWNGYLLLIYCASDVTNVFRLEGGSFVHKLNISTAYDGRAMGIVAEDGTFGIVSSTTAGTKAFQISTGWTSTDRTSGLPSGISSRISNFVFAFNDRETNGPTGNMRSIAMIMDYNSDTTTGVMSLGSWSTPTFTDLGTISAARQLALSVPPGGEGYNLWTSGEQNIIIKKTEPATGGMKVTFRAYGGGSFNLELLVEKNSLGSIPGVAPDGCFRGTLANPSTGTLTDGNKKLTGLTADGTTEYYVTWASATDTVANGTWCEIRPVITGVV